FDELHHERRHACLFLDAVNRRDVRMVQRGEHLGLALKPRKAIGVGRQLDRQDLDRDVPLQPCVGRAIHLTHSAGAERADNLVRAESRARRERHVRSTSAINPISRKHVRKSNAFQPSTSLPPAALTMTIPENSTTLPVAGTPSASPRCVPFTRHCTAATSPCFTIRSIVTRRSGNAARNWR